MNAAAAWDEVISELQSLYNIANIHAARFHVSDEISVTSDDEGMAETSDDNLIAWVDDLEARCGYEVRDMRAAIVEYCEVRAMENLEKLGFRCTGEPLQDATVSVNGVTFDCFIDASMFWLGDNRPCLDVSSYYARKRDARIFRL